jgi:hypothetical protein
MNRRVFAPALLALSALGCTSSPQGLSSLEGLADRAQKLAQAQQLVVWTGDFDGDGILDIALSGDATAPAGPANQAPQALPPQDAVVLVHDQDGNLVAASSNAFFKFSSAQRLAQFALTSVEAEIQALADAITQGSCILVGALSDLLAKAIAEAGVKGTSWYDQVLVAMLGASSLPDVLGPQPKSVDETLAGCLATPQTPIGCLALRAMVWVRDDLCMNSGVGPCGLLQSGTHCYQVDAPAGETLCPDPGVHSSLCTKTAHPSECCNADFVYNTIFLADLRNQAPMPVLPPAGPMPQTPTTILLGGPKILTDAYINSLNPIAKRPMRVLACIMDAAVNHQQNPITLSIDPSTRTGTNTTQLGHFLQGQVDQVVSEVGGDVVSTITGTQGAWGQDARWAGLNELLGPQVLGTVRDIFRQHVTDTLATIDSLGLCCAGGTLVGGTATVLPGGGLDIKRSAGTTCNTCPGFICATNADCCIGNCAPNVCVCNQDGMACSLPADCCSGKCTNNVCMP